MNDFSNSLAGLAILGGSAGFALTAQPRIESRAVRLAKAQFTLPAVTPPWKAERSDEPLSVSVGAIRRLRSIVDPEAGRNSLPPDVQTAFTAYKALDRLRLLAEWVVQNPAGTKSSAGLQTVFANGLADLQAYLGGTSGGALNLAFGTVARRSESIAVKAKAAPEVRGAPVSTGRSVPLEGMTGLERLTIRLGKPGVADSVEVDLSSGPQPPTLDSVAASLNAAIAAVPARGPDGAILFGPDGIPARRWFSSFSVVKSNGGWGLQLDGMGSEEVALGEAGAGQSLMIALGQTPQGGATATALMRFDLPGEALRRTDLARLQAIDGPATRTEALLGKGAARNIAAALESQAMAVGPDGFTYVVGTSNGDLGTNISSRQRDLVLSKIAPDGHVAWQRSLGTAGSAEGAAISISAEGDILVAGTAQGDIDGALSDGDMIVGRFTPAGDEKFLTLVRSAGADRASAVALGANGEVLVGGRAGVGDGDAAIVRLDGAGRFLERRLIDTGVNDSVRALRTGADGSTLALTVEDGEAILRRIGAGGLADTDSINLGRFDARSLAISADGRIAVGGAEGPSGHVTTLDSSFSILSQTRIASGALDQVDSVQWVEGKLYAGGRTSGILGATKMGEVDGFVARIDPEDGATLAVSQWGRAGVRAEPVTIAAAPAKSSALTALGFRSGVLNPPESEKLVAATSLRAGDHFSLRIDDGPLRKLVIEAGDTMTTLAARIGKLLGRNGSASAARADAGVTLRMEPKSGHSLQIVAGKDGHDVLAKLGLEPNRISVAPPLDPKAPRVRPGGQYGLELSDALSIADKRSAAASLTRIQSALSTTQSAFRSLYWDDTKAALIDGGKGGSVSPYLAGQVARYQDALERLGGGGSW